MIKLIKKLLKKRLFWLWFVAEILVFGFFVWAFRDAAIKVIIEETPEVQRQMADALKKFLASLGTPVGHGVMKYYVGIMIAYIILPLMYVLYQLHKLICWMGLRQLKKDHAAELERCCNNQITAVN